jgi:hypothetical protein
MGNTRWSVMRKTAAVLVLALAAFIYGFVASERDIPPGGIVRDLYDWTRHQPRFRRTFQVVRDRIAGRRMPKGRWAPVRPHPSLAELTGEERRAAAQLRSIGYLSGYEPAPTTKGVTIHLPDLAYNGYNLVVSGHAQEALLMDMAGKVLHRWTHDASATFPEFGELEGIEIETSFNLHTWRRAYLYANGDLLAIYEGAGMIRLDRDSDLLWALTQGCHHDVFVNTDGTIYVLTRKYRVLPRLDPTRPVIEDFITILDPAGKVLRTVSLLEAFEKSSYAAYLGKSPEYGDLFHTNTIQVLDGAQAHRSPIFKQGNVLVSVRNLDVIAIVDMETEEVVWALSGQWKAQHEPILLASGNILLLDNQGHRGMSKVIEIDPFTQQIVWAYYGTPANGFGTETCGSNQRLPNGNTLVVESDSGRAFEVTPGGQIVWEYYNPARAGDDGELIATLFDVVRLDPGYVAGWLIPPDIPSEP